MKKKQQLSQTLDHLQTVCALIYYILLIILYFSHALQACQNTAILVKIYSDTIAMH